MEVEKAKWEADEGILIRGMNYCFLRKMGHRWIPVIEIMALGIRV